jgi:spore coat polysaccharide biosynthesis predicted glycosyltransferase SpsG
LHAATLPYPSEPSTRLLLGPRYALLREEFWAWRDWQRPAHDRPPRLLLSLGGSDPDDVTGGVLRALIKGSRRAWTCLVLAGALNPHLAALTQLAATHPGRFELATVSTRMPDEMAAADLAISAGGSTCWELAFMGLPNLVITLAENQEQSGPALAACGVSVNLGWHRQLTDAALAAAVDDLLADVARRHDMSARGRALVDGWGASRVVENMLVSASST